jgi:hypothetical protein
VEIVEKVKTILIELFPPPAKVELWDEDGIIGTVTSPRFQDMEPIDRINLIWDALDKGLTPEERRRVVTIVAATPQEEIAYTA